MIIAVILLMLGSGGRVKAGFFVLGCLLGTMVVTGVFMFISAGAVPKTDDGGPHVVSGIIKIVLGAALLWLAVHTWRNRPRSEADFTTPGWVAKIEGASLAQAFIVPFLLQFLPSKSTPLVMTAGVHIGDLVQQTSVAEGHHRQRDLGVLIPVPGPCRRRDPHRSVRVSSACARRDSNPKPSDP
ncbi:GAP family protein [Gordonia sp. (in: high G+C Gram-positive bacteria)]|uniref:GAP family protein n=1 Tax=Gordonia sp. (in: high G+C Gram-positive bacteria) TaxID=84139 RepID=UPI0039E4817D